MPSQPNEKSNKSKAQVSQPGAYRLDLLKQLAKQTIEFKFKEASEFSSFMISRCIAVAEQYPKKIRDQKD